MAHNSLRSLPRGRPREFDPDQVVERAMNVFWTNGYHGTSLPDLLQATKLSRGSLYTAFGDKHGLFLCALDRYIDDAVERLHEDLDPRQSALAGLRKFLTGYVDRTSGAKGRRGCLVVAAAMELATHDVEVEKRIRRFFITVETSLIRALERARSEGKMVEGCEPASAARVLLSMAEGIRVVAKTGIDRVVWQSSVDALLKLFLR